MESGNLRWIVLAIMLLAIGVAFWLFRDAWLPKPVEAPVAQAPAAPPAEEPAESPFEPIYPVPPIDPGDTGGQLVPLPPLDDSDEYFRLALIDLFGSRLDELLVQDLLIERSVGSVDNLPRERVSEKIRPLGRLPGTFAVEETGGDVGGDAGYLLSAQNYERYEGVVELLEAADVDELIDTYRRFYPLLNEAYTMLGYPDAHFNDRVVEVLDALLATPEPEGPVELVREHVLFAYRDPELEALASGQKMLLRMGNDNAQRVKRVLRSIRDDVTTLAVPPPTDNGAESR